jgi:hypothetical protein
MRALHVKKARILRFAPLALATCALVACGGGGSSGGAPPNGTIKGTVAVGAPLVNAQVTVTCKNGAATTSSNGNGFYTTTFAFDGPCTISATSGSTVLHSFAPGPGNYNISALTELLLVYLAAQLNTTLDGLQAGMETNPTFQSALTNSTVIANAENGVAALIRQNYDVTLSTASFLTIPFTPGQPADADLDLLSTKGAVQASGQPAPALLSATTGAGKLVSLAPGSGSGGATGGTGGTSGTGTATQ